MMRVGEIWKPVHRYVGKLPARVDGKRHSLADILRTKPPSEVLAALTSLTEAFKNQRATDRNPSLTQLEAFVKSNAALTLVDLTGGDRPARPADAVAEYTARIQRVFNGNGRGFFDIIKELDVDVRIKTPEMRAIATAVLGTSTGKLTRKAAKEAMISEFATLEVGRVSTDAAMRSRPY